MNYKGNLIDFSCPLLMGVINITQDSFYSGSRIRSEKELVAQTEKMLAEGADIIDIGAISTRPGVEAILPEREEAARLSASVAVIKRYFPQAIISIDTFRAAVVHKLVQKHGELLINDISGGTFDSEMFEAIAQLKLPYILMHLQGNIQNMHTQTHYNSLLGDIIGFFSRQVQKLIEMGVSDIIIDPGFGFSKTIEQNYEILQKLQYFKILGKPILAGFSRKSMLYKTLNTTPENALNATTAANALALTKGVSILRVHDVKEAKELVTIFAAAKQYNNI